jgi:hypothetical protein
MIRNFRRLLILHFALGIVSIVAYFMRPGSHAPHDARSGRTFALTVLLKVFLAWTPYIISCFYACNVLPPRDAKATTLFIFVAVAVGIVAACLNMGLFGMNASPAPPLVFAGVTIVLIATARLCATIWRDDVADWNSHQ